MQLTQKGQNLFWAILLILIIIGSGIAIIQENKITARNTEYKKIEYKVDTYITQDSINGITYYLFITKDSILVLNINNNTYSLHSKKFYKY